MDIVKPCKYMRIDKLSNNKTYILIPRGKKCFIYFTYYNDKPCVMLYNKDKKYMKRLYTCFDEDLSVGTIIYGTLIKNTFIGEYLCMYKGKKLQHNLNNYNILQGLLSTDIKNTSNTLQIKLPFMCNTKSILYYTNISYTVYGILEYGHRFNIYIIQDMLANFIIKKDDLIQYKYNLYDNKSKYHTKAYINDIKTTFLVDTIFKKRKNYKNIEYSEDEGDDEDEDVSNRYVTCIYIPQIKKWKPYLMCNTADTWRHIRRIETTYN